MKQLLHTLRLSYPKLTPQSLFAAVPKFVMDSASRVGVGAVWELWGLCGAV